MGVRVHGRHKWCHMSRLGLDGCVCLSYTPDMEAVGRVPWAWSTWACHMPFMFVNGVCGGNGCGAHIPQHMDAWVPGHPSLWVCRSFASTCVCSRLDVAACGEGVMPWLLSHRPVAQCPSPASHSRKLAHGVRCSRLVGASTSMHMSALCIACQSDSMCVQWVQHMQHTQGLPMHHPGPCVAVACRIAIMSVFQADEQLPRGYGGSTKAF